MYLMLIIYVAKYAIIEQHFHLRFLPLLIMLALKHDRKRYVHKVKR